MKRKEEGTMLFVFPQGKVKFDRTVEKTIEEANEIIADINYYLCHGNLSMIAIARFFGWRNISLAAVDGELTVTDAKFDIYSCDDFKGVIRVRMKWSGYYNNPEACVGYDEELDKDLVKKGLKSYLAACPSPSVLTASMGAIIYPSKVRSEHILALANDAFRKKVDHMTHLSESETGTETLEQVSDRLDIVAEQLCGIDNHLGEVEQDVKSVTVEQKLHGTEIQMLVDQQHNVISKLASAADSAKKHQKVLENHNKILNRIVDMKADKEAVDKAIDATNVAMSSRIDALCNTLERAIDAQKEIIAQQGELRAQVATLILNNDISKGDDDDAE